ncbi:Phosphoribosylaminoimidazole-succinocarboxamide synthase [Candidatus Gugararchaeum adminiculabundum]|nr:Phosphoribosylaminoimidazole-succinocarboxamide synthase [Candidatus Gugararchaeum adminiculabundum]
MAEPVITKASLPYKLFSSGKVRDTFEYEDKLLMVSTDRLSAFDVIFPQGIPYKGIVLNELSLFWFDFLKGITKNHIAGKLPPSLPRDYRRRSMLVKRAKPVKLECVVRGYLVGSGWKEYQKSQSICGIHLPSGLKLASKLPETLFTPSTKGEIGEHDINLDKPSAIRVVGKEVYDEVREKATLIYEAAADYAETKGIILADTKFEFGECDGEIILIDEVLTPDSSRFWPADQYEEGTSPPSFDKQFVRDYVEKLGWGKKPPAPLLPPEVINGTVEKYIEAYEKLTGKKFVR